MERTGSYFRRTARAVASLALAGAVVLGVGVAPASAQGYYGDRYPNNRYRTLSRGDVQRIATINGYGDGYEHGVMDRRYRRGASFRDAAEYRRGLNGFDRSWGHERDYQNSYRGAYSRGYSDGYYGRARNRSYGRDRLPYYGGYPGYGNYPYYDNGRGDLSRDEVARRAAENGYRMGFQWGQNDAVRRNRPNPQGHGAYQHGLDGYARDWGWASVYQQTYRSYFLRGYNDGYNRRAYNRYY